ncbi:PREDICTED: olfactory receptor 1361-like [Nanorana parkeri]|uniref:olfactory receptor 1361-like n=1 Tax=Nanorana parkeri TaxID=125878 RepID=UPI00085485B1|nr:PREDICTED: olfactory receptor 1361-like [Nanorana parkeri]
MKKENASSGTYFVLQALSDNPQIQCFVFISFLAIYLLILLGNSAIMAAVHLDSNLSGAPMYMLLGHLSFLDMCYTTVTFPKMLVGLLLDDQTITFGGCFAQLFFFISFGQTESFLLAVMAYDRYVAICCPLHYVDRVTRWLCVCLTGLSWFSGFLNAALHTGLAARLSFCSSNQIGHFFCDITPLLKISCVSTVLNEIVIYVAGIFIVCTPFLCILLSYVYILLAIIRIPSAKGRHKTFSTCSSHLTVVCMFYGTVLLMYMRPASYSGEHDKIFALLYTFITPLLNPFIYGLKSMEVKEAFKKFILHGRTWRQPYRHNLRQAASHQHWLWAQNGSTFSPVAIYSKQRTKNVTPLPLAEVEDDGSHFSISL